MLSPSVMYTGNTHCRLKKMPCNRPASRKDREKRDLANADRISLRCQSVLLFWPQTISMV